MKQREKKMKKRRAFITFCVALIFIPTQLFAATEEQYNEQQQNMVKIIDAHWEMTHERFGKETLDEQVRKVMATVPRHEFVPARLRSFAYDDRPLPIGHGQTISQPFIVALMTHLLDVNENDVVLEIGTGSGYQAAILAPLVRKVYTIEIIKELGEQARKRLKRLKYDNVEVRVGDGYYGWEEHAPFDGIIVTAAASHIPPPLIKQLKLGGRMVIPVGSPFMTQQLMLVEKQKDGKVKNRQLLPVAFVPLTGGH
jgi:protein-L-isoaspartate(D-aspartate) O-methyltransferase